MKTVSFIVEGESERVVLESDAFTQYLKRYGLKADILIAQGCGNIKNSSKLTELIRASQIKNPNSTVVVLLDFDEATCYTAVRSQVPSVSLAPNMVVCIVRKALESWFLADSEAVQRWLGKPWEENNPESVAGKPFDYMHQLSKRFGGGGTSGSKRKFSRKMISHGFSLERAAQHPNCPSAAYFLTKLRSLSSVSEIQTEEGI